MLTTRTAVVLALMTLAVASCGSSADGVAGSDTRSAESTELGSDDEPNATAAMPAAPTAPAPTGTTSPPSATTANEASPAGLDEYCALWSDIQAATADSALDSEAAWQQRVEWTEEIARLAPDEYQDQAGVYLTLVLAREQLVSEYGYVPVQELPADVRTAFISDHAAEQQISNELIEFSTSTCLPPTDDQ